ncbi:hypothetical protein [Arthrobacter sp. StoSoilB22]|uniref:hypothetical protein n=1 Tax=Arthrobacter sp. StoSoilB22 TaxID=2830996 RepID=UPI001CC6A93F|nr:hypothetical protein [Arthrobacter sp. StoSoilB22]BCW61829.1 hypothetical protein StoSoilB22_08020 [Arthrobacter sp. StoSoilB22]
MEITRENSPECMAYTDGPDGSTFCNAPGPFVVERVYDTSLVVCAEHLGSILLHAKNVQWPPAITWEGPGQRPPNTYTADQYAQREAEVHKRLFSKES